MFMTKSMGFTGSSNAHRESFGQSKTKAAPATEAVSRLLLFPKNVRLVAVVATSSAALITVTNVALHHRGGRLSIHMWRPNGSLANQNRVGRSWIRQTRLLFHVHVDLRRRTGNRMRCVVVHRVTSQSGRTAIGMCGGPGKPMLVPTRGIP